VYYEGTASQWNAINIDAENPDLLNANIHFGKTEPVYTYKYRAYFKTSTDGNFTSAEEALADVEVTRTEYIDGVESQVTDITSSCVMSVMGSIIKIYYNDVNVGTLAFSYKTITYSYNAYFKSGKATFDSDEEAMLDVKVEKITYTNGEAEDDTQDITSSAIITCVNGTIIVTVPDTDFEVALKYTLNIPDTYTLSGSVYSPELEIPVSNSVVYLYEGKVLRGMTLTNGDGTYSFNVNKGTYTVMVSPAVVDTFDLTLYQMCPVSKQVTVYDDIVMDAIDVKLPLYADITGDGKVDINDATEVRASYTNEYTLNTEPVVIHQSGNGTGIRGTVYSHEFERPLDDALVYLYQNSKLIAISLTDYEGKYSFDVASGTYTVIVYASITDTYDMTIYQMNTVKTEVTIEDSIADMYINVSLPIYGDINCDGKVDINDMVEVKASYTFDETEKPAVSEITFNTVDGKIIIAPLKVYEGTTITPSMLPGESVVTKPGVTFGEWLYEETPGNWVPVPPTGVTVNSDLHLQAKWMAGITYVCDDRDVEIAKDKVEIGDPVTPIANPTREGYTFAGWYTDTAYTTQYTFGPPVTDSIVLYAKWVSVPVIKYTVTFDTDGGSAVAPYYNVTSGSKINAPVTTREGYNFLGWYKPDNTLFDFDTSITSDIKLTAKWELLMFTVTLDIGNGEVQTLINVEYGSTISEPIFDRDREGYEFAGWFRQPDGMGGVFNFNHDEITEDTTIYGWWIRKFYSLYLDMLGGKLNGSDDIRISVNHGETMPEFDDPVKENAVFGGWYKDAAYTTPFVFNVDIITSDITIYAKWIYTVSFDSTGGTIVPSRQVVHSYSLDMVYPEPTKPGMVFAGWYTDIEYSENSFELDTPITDSITLYAKWVDADELINNIYELVENFNNYDYKEIVNRELSDYILEIKELYLAQFEGVINAYNNGESIYKNYLKDNYQEESDTIKELYRTMSADLKMEFKVILLEIMDTHLLNIAEYFYIPLLNEII